MNQTPYNYISQETLFSSGRTIIQRSTRQQDNITFILKKCAEESPTQAQLQRLSFSYDVAKKFDHPNILKVVDYFELGGVPTIVQEDTHSIDLRQYIKQQPDQRLSLDTFLIIAIQLADALSEIHHEQVIHKDLHPGNIIINPETQQVQIIDFGLASLLSREQPSLAAPERLEGILAYLSPEQTGRMNRAVDYRSDFYTLGITFYELLSGHVPFRAVDALGMVHAHIAKPHKPLSKVCPGFPPAISTLIDKLLNKIAEKRYQSAQGLKVDLEKCQQLLNSGNPQQSFPLGENDISDRFHVSQTLYGRKKEINTLLKHFHKVAKGSPQLFAVSGYSGIGKSVLVHEVHKPIAASNGLFLTGKFDQFQRNIPYSVFYQALKSWLMQMLSQPEKQLQAQRQRINKILGSNAWVLIDFMVEFKPLLGELPEVPKLGADETQNRFHVVFVKLITFIAEDRPLVLFIDDLQWADRGSLNLLPLLMREADCHLLIIVAYRDNEVDETHPAIQTLQAIKNDENNVSSLSLKPLSVNDVRQVLIDSLHRPAEEVQSLAVLVHNKTGGNPFFINEFLKTLYSEELLNFDLKQHRWLWDTQAITDKCITDNVVELMLGKMQKLPEETQQILRLASCIGSYFDIDMLAVVAEKDVTELNDALWPALKGGLLIQGGSGCQFLHDRMLQAAYESMEDTQRQKTHLKIGRLLNKLKKYHQQKGETYSTLQPISLFDIVEQLNKGRSLITDPSERLRLVELNQQAAEKAKAASVWDAVVRYSDIGIALLPKNSWQEQYQLSFDLYHAKAEGEYLCGRPDVSDLLYSELLFYTHDNLIKAEICATRVVENIGRGRWSLGIEIGLQGLAYLGVDLSGDPERVSAMLVQEQALFDMQTEHTSIHKIHQLPELSDPQWLTALQILFNLGVCALLLRNRDLMKLAALSGLNITLKSGQSDLVIAQLMLYAMILVRESQYQQATTLAIESKKLREHYSQPRELASSYNGLASYILYFSEPYKHCIALLQIGYEAGLENGEIARAVIGQGNALSLKFSKGDNLYTVQEYAEEFQMLCHRKTIFYPIGHNIMTMMTALRIPTVHGSEALDYKTLTQEHLDKIKGSVHEEMLIHCRVALAFWYGDNEKALTNCRLVTHKIGFSVGLCLSVDHTIYYGLLLLSQASGQGLESPEILTYCLAQMKKLAQFCPANFEHKYQLLLAEQGRSQNDSMEQVTEHYKKAIESAKENGFLQYQALGNELLGLYWQSKGLESAATAYLEQAVYLYKRWGCEARIVYLKKHYGCLLKFDEARDGTSESSAVSLTQSGDDSHSSPSSHAQSEDKSGLDFDSVMKSSQLISSELKLKQLALKVMQVITESAGAQTAALVLNTQNGPCVEARVSSLPDSSESLGLTMSPQLTGSQALDKCSDLPLSVISYVLRTDKIVNLDDIQGSKEFRNDPYLKVQPPESILCVPVDYRDNLIGVLYLENRLTTKAFTESRLNVIKMLLSQTAISIENARLFEEINTLNQRLEEKVEERTQQLSESNTALQIANEELKSFSYSVSHDLRSPLRSIRGFSQILLDEYSDKLDDMGASLLQRIMAGSSKMAELINGLLELSRVQSQDIDLKQVNLSKIAQEISNELNESQVDRPVKFICAEDMEVQGDARMLYSAMENLLNNAWKYSSKVMLPCVEFGFIKQQGRSVYFIKDNGAGFDMAHAHNLFGTFQRLHSENEFSGTGIGLATVKRIINKHKGEIWAEAEEGKGAIFYFTL